MLYTEFLKGIGRENADSEGVMEAYKDARVAMLCDPSIEPDEAFCLFCAADYDWIDNPQNERGHIIESAARGRRNAMIAEDYAREIVHESCCFDPSAIRIRGAAFNRNEDENFIRFEVGTYCWVLADGLLHKVTQ